jgi:hypothetical protein
VTGSSARGHAVQSRGPSAAVQRARLQRLPTGRGWQPADLVASQGLCRPQRDTAPHPALRPTPPPPAPCSPQPQHPVCAHAEQAAPGLRLLPGETALGAAHADQGTVEESQPARGWLCELPGLPLALALPAARPQAPMPCCPSSPHALPAQQAPYLASPAARTPCRPSSSAPATHRAARLPSLAAACAHRQPKELPPRPPQDANHDPPCLPPRPPQDANHDPPCLPPRPPPLRTRTTTRPACPRPCPTAQSSAAPTPAARRPPQPRRQPSCSCASSARRMTWRRR